jgi:N4-gp56 family major capsid protein
MALYGDASITPRIGFLAEKKMLEHAEPILVLNKFAMSKPLPRNVGTSVMFRRPVPLALATTPLTENVTPPQTTFAYENVPIAVNEYGAWMGLTNKITDLHEDPVGSDMAMLSGEQAAETIEMIMHGVVVAGTQVIRANGAARTDINTGLTLGHVRQAVRTLRRQRAKKLTEVLASSPNYATRAVEASYVAICHSDLDYAIRSLAGFTAVANYGNRQPLCAEEIGSVEDVRFITYPLFAPFMGQGSLTVGSNLNSAGAGGNRVDVYPILVLGKHAFGAIALKGSSEFGGAIKPIVRQPGTADSNDPLARSGSVAWKTWFGCGILNQNWMVRIEVAALAVPS